MNYIRLEDKIDIFDNDNENDNENENIYNPKNLKSQNKFTKDNNTIENSMCLIVLVIIYLIIYVITFFILFAFYYSRKE